MLADRGLDKKVTNMPKDLNWKYDLEEYIRQGEPGKAEKSAAWQTAIGLQDVDGLKTSEYLIETAKDHIEGKINITQAQDRIHSYYEERKDRGDIEASTKEADIVSARITEILSEKTFQFSPAELQSIHKRLFSGIFNHAGQFRTYNITKKEWVLNGETVIYSAYDSIRDTLDYDFRQEKQFLYEDLSAEEAIKHISAFTSGIWQIHPFGEGNTRTTAVFILKYLRTFGFTFSNDAFAENSWYFRNALVRSNYNDFNKGISATNKYLDAFFENLILGSGNELKNRYMHVDYDASQSAKNDILKCQNVTLELSLEETAILMHIKDNPYITQAELAEKTGKSKRTIIRWMLDLQEKSVIKRENGKRNGKWVVL